MARLLYVEDETALRTALAAYLRMQGLEVREAGGFHEALQLLAEQSFDMLVTDQELGDGRGSDLVARFRREQSGPALICTATPERVREDPLVGDGVDLMPKPLRPARLGEWISEHRQHVCENEASGLRPIWQQLVAEGWAPEEIDRVLLVLSELPAVKMLDLRREGERLVLLVSAVHAQSLSSVGESLGVDSWRVETVDGQESLAVAIPLRWRSQAELAGTLDLAGCESWSMTQIVSALEDAHRRGLCIANLSSWHRLGLRLLGREQLVRERGAETQEYAAEQRLLWPSAGSVKEAKSGRL
ncbi:MAG: hypothetical protein CSA62_02365 [Planctomycetota bacterium]|nr:MAG: hypothetical protein CSA62_02365 [Planctomycetota bacterium]